MVKIQGTPCMPSHISVHPATTKYFPNSFVFKTKIEKEGLRSDSPAGLGAGGLRFESGRPDQSFLRLTGISKKSFPHRLHEHSVNRALRPSFSSRKCFQKPHFLPYIPNCRLARTTLHAAPCPPQSPDFFSLSGNGGTSK